MTKITAFVAKVSTLRQRMKSELIVHAISFRGANLRGDKNNSALEPNFTADLLYTITYKYEERALQRAEMRNSAQSPL